MQDEMDLDRESLEALIRADESEMEEYELVLWKIVQIPPVLWEMNPEDQGGGLFWVVAIFGQRVAYYNSIEEGFNVAVYPRWGHLHKHDYDTQGLHHAMRSLWWYAGELGFEGRWPTLGAQASDSP